MKVRSWGQGNHLISAILVQPCGCCDNTVWLMTKRESLPADEEGKRQLTECTYECLTCRTEMVVSFEHWIYPEKNKGKPLPENKASLEFYKQFTKEDAHKALDTVAGQKVKCFICTAEGAMTGALNQTGLKIAGLQQGQLVEKEVKALCCDLCRAELQFNMVVQCATPGCTEWVWMSRQGFFQSYGHLIYPDAQTAFHNADIVFGPEWTCSLCKAKKTGWLI